MLELTCKECGTIVHCEDDAEVDGMPFRIWWRDDHFKHNHEDVVPEIEVTSV